MADLSGKAALVTGATVSINEAIVRSLHAAGASVLVTGIQDAEGQAIAKSLGLGAIYQHMDLRSDADIRTALQVCRDRFGRLDIVVNAACTYVGSYEGRAAGMAADPTGGLTASREEWHASLDVNVVGHAILIDEALAYLTQPGGVVVNIGSTAGKAASYDTGPYPVGKAALLHMTKSYAVALGRRGIRVVAVSPGWTADSPPALGMSGGNLELFDKATAQVTPLSAGRGGRMREVADVVVFACSEEASWVNGCDIPVDGGFTVWAADRGYGPQWWVNFQQSE